jgi:hypothetical protein
MAATQDERIAELQRTIAELRQERDADRAVTVHPECPDEHMGNVGLCAVFALLGLPGRPPGKLSSHHKTR